MPLGITRSPSLGIQPRLPVWIRWVNGEPKILAGGVPVIPFNTALKHRARHDGATRKSLAAYARAGALYATYCAHQGVGLLDIANDEFPSFVDGLLGLKFRNATGPFDAWLASDPLHFARARVGEPVHLPLPAQGRERSRHARPAAPTAGPLTLAGP